MDLRVDTDALRADASGLSASATPAAAGGAPRCDPAAADPVSVSMAGALTQWSHALWTLMEHAGKQREAGGVSLAGVAAHLRAVDDANAAHIANSVAGASAGPSVPTSPPPTAGAGSGVPTLPAIPDIPSPPPLTAEQVSAMVHSGPGPDRLRAFAQQWRHTVAPHILATAEETRRHGNSIAQDWNDGDPQAARTVLEHADWLQSTLHPSVLRLADSADQAASHAETVIANIARPEEFNDLHTRLNTEVAKYRASGGVNAGQVIALNNELGEKQATAVAGYQTYAAAAPVAASGAAQPPAPAPAIVRGGPQAATLNPQPGDGKPQTHGGDSGDGDRNGKSTGKTLQPATADSGPVGPAGIPPVAPAPQPGADPPAGMVANIAGTIMGTGMGTVGQLANGLHGIAGGGAPLSALSSLSSLPGLGGLPNTSMPQMPGGPGDGGGDSPADLGDGGDFGSEGTSPATDGAGGGAGGGGAPVSSSSPAVSGAPAAAGPTVGAPAAGGAGAAPAGVGGGGMFAPPLMGGMGRGDDEGRRKADDKRRVVHRPIPNTEPVFGEVERKHTTRRQARKEEP